MEPEVEDDLEGSIKKRLYFLMLSLRLRVFTLLEQLTPTPRTNGVQIKATVGEIPSSISRLSEIPPQLGNTLRRGGTVMVSKSTSQLHLTENWAYILFVNWSSKHYALRASQTGFWQSGPCAHQVQSK